MFNRNRIVCTDWYETEEYMWMALSDKNAICKIKKETEEVSVLGCYPGHKISEGLLSSRIVFADGKLVFVPCLASSIAVVNIETDEIAFLPFPEKEYHAYKVSPKFLNGFVQDGMVYMCGFAYPAMFQINLERNEVKCVVEFERQKREKYAYLGIVKQNQEWLFPVDGDGELMSVSFDLKHINFRKNEANCGSFFALSKNEDRMWMTCVDAKKNFVVSYNVKTGKVEKIPLAVPGRYYAPVFYQGIAYFFPHEGEYVVVVDTKDGYKSRICEELSQKHCFGDWAAVMAIKQIGSIVKFVTGGNRCWYEYDFESCTLSKKCYELSEEVLGDEWEQDMFRVMTSRNNAVVENELFLSEFIHILGEQTAEKSETGEKCGKKIYDALKEW